MTWLRDDGAFVTGSDCLRLVIGFGAMLRARVRVWRQSQTEFIRHRLTKNNRQAREIRVAANVTNQAWSRPATS